MTQDIDARYHVKLLEVKAHDTAQAVADLQARMQSVEEAIARLERIKADELIAEHGSDANPDPYAAWHWIPHTGNECPVPEDRRDEYTYVLFPGCDPNVFGSPWPADQWEWGSDSIKTHWRYADPMAAKTAYEAWAADQVLTASKINALNDAKRADSRPEYPWRDQPLLFGKSIIESMDMTAINKKLSDMMGDGAAVDAKPAKRKKWGPWVEPGCKQTLDEQWADRQVEWRNGKPFRVRIKL